MRDAELTRLAHLDQLTLRATELLAPSADLRTVAVNSLPATVVAL